MRGKGFFIVPNEFFDQPTFRRQKFSVRMALIYLYKIRNSSDKPYTFINDRNHTIAVNKNECHFALDWIAKEWGVAKNTANNYLKILAKNRFIELKQNRQGTRIRFLHLKSY